MTAAAASTAASRGAMPGVEPSFTGSRRVSRCGDSQRACGDVTAIDAEDAELAFRPARERSTIGSRGVEAARPCLRTSGCSATTATTERRAPNAPPDDNQHPTTSDTQGRPTLFSRTSARRTGRARGQLFLVVFEPVLSSARNSVAVHVKNGEDVVDALLRVGYSHLRDDCLAFGHHPEHFDRPAFGIDAVELDEVLASANPQARVWPFHDEVVGEEATEPIPVARLNPIPESDHHVARLHGVTIGLNETSSRAAATSSSSVIPTSRASATAELREHGLFGEGSLGAGGQIASRGRAAHPTHVTLKRTNESERFFRKERDSQPGTPSVPSDRAAR